MKLYPTTQLHPATVQVRGGSGYLGEVTNFAQRPNEIQWVEKNLRIGGAEFTDVLVLDF